MSATLEKVRGKKCMSQIRCAPQKKRIPLCLKKVSNLWGEWVSRQPKSESVVLLPKSPKSKGIEGRGNRWRGKKDLFHL